MKRVQNFIVSFLLIHSVSWVASVLHSFLCVDASWIGFFRNMLYGHSPICYSLVSVTYHASHHMSMLVTTLLLTTGLTKLN